MLNKIHNRACYNTHAFVYYLVAKQRMQVEVELPIGILQARSRNNNQLKFTNPKITNANTIRYSQ